MSRLTAALLNTLPEKTKKFISNYNQEDTIPDRDRGLEELAYSLGQPITGELIKKCRAILLNASQLSCKAEYNQSLLRHGFRDDKNDKDQGSAGATIANETKQKQENQGFVSALANTAAGPNGISV